MSDGSEEKFIRSGIGRPTLHCLQLFYLREAIIFAFVFLYLRSMYKSGERERDREREREREREESFPFHIATRGLKFK